MKRKTSEPNPNGPFQIRISSQRGFHGIRSSDSRFPIITPQRTADISCKKRGKFTTLDDENQRPARCEVADNAKTSEYAFFKKLKEDASHKVHSCSLRDETYQTKNSKSRECSRERINMIRNKNVDIGASLRNENASPELNMKIACATLEDVHRKQNVMVEEYKNALRTKGQNLSHFEETEAQNWDAEVFDRKRQKLRQWVAETSFPEIDELCSKGYDFVSVLLSRLIPKCNEKNKFKDPKLMQAETNHKSMSLPSYESDMRFEKLQRTPTRNLMELECGPCWDDTISSCWSKRSRERISCSNSPTTYPYRSHFQYTVWEPESELLGGTAISYAKNDSQSVLPFNEYGLVASSYVKEMDVLCQPYEYLVERESRIPMLGWDFDSTKEDRNLSNLWRYRAEHTSTSLANYHNDDFLGHCLEGNGDMQSGFYQIPLTLSCVPSFINLTEDCFSGTACKMGSTIYSLQNDHGFTTKIMNEGRYHPNTESLLSSGFDSNLGWNYLPLTGSSRENYSSTSHDLQFLEREDMSSRLLTYHDDKYERCLDDSSHTRSLTHFIEDSKVRIHDSSPFCLQISLDREKAWPLLLLDNSSRDGIEREVYFDDSDVNVDDGKVNSHEWLHSDVCKW